MQTYLEKQAIEKRGEILNENQFDKENEYSINTKVSKYDSENKKNELLINNQFGDEKEYSLNTKISKYDNETKRDNLLVKNHFDKDYEYSVNTAKSKFDSEAKRNELMVGNVYDSSNEYSSRHKNALSDGDSKGRGLGNGGHGHYLPNQGLSKSAINYGNLNTNAGGTSYDINGNPRVNNGLNGRVYLENISLYGPKNEYGPTLIDSTLNRAEGQIVI